MLAGFATRTTRMLLGTDILVAPFYHPVRLAEDAAMLDMMSGGRLIVGSAIGYKPDEFALYGAELEKRGARFEEQLAIMKALWTQDWVSHKGRYYQIEGTLEPKPVAKPHPPIWIGGWGDITLAAGGHARRQLGSRAHRRAGPPAQGQAAVPRQSPGGRPAPRPSPSGR